MDTYRHISILLALSKILQKWVAKQIIEHLENSHTSLYLMQFGFCSHHSTQTAFIVFLEKNKGLLDRNGFVGAVILDFKKTFQTTELYLKISQFQLFCTCRNTTWINWIKSYLTNRKQYAMVNGVSLPQVSSRGPSRFNTWTAFVLTVY